MPADPIHFVSVHKWKSYTPPSENDRYKFFRTQVANSLRYQGEKSLIGVATDLCSAQLISEGSYQERRTKTKANIKNNKKMAQRKFFHTK